MKDIAVVYEGNTTTSALLSRILGSTTETAWALGKDFDVYHYLGKTPFFLRSSDPALFKSVRALKLAKHPYIYYTDDNFWLIDGDSNLGDFYSNPTIRRSLAFLASGASVVICHTEIFAKFLRRFNNNIVILPAFFDFNLISSRIEKPGQPSEFRIGIVSNESKAADVMLACQAAIAAIDQIGEIAWLEIIGHYPSALLDHPRIRHFDNVSDYSQFIKLQFSRGWNVGLAPLLKSKHSNYKTNNKYREYGGCGIAGIYSKCDLYCESVQDGVSGWLVDNDRDAWASGIINAFNNPSLTAEIGAFARRDVESKYKIDNVSRAWSTALAPYTKLSNLLWSKLRLAQQKKARTAGVADTPNIISARKNSDNQNPLLAYTSKDSVFNLMPGEKMVCNVDETYTGDFIFTGMFATFGIATSGVVVIEHKVGTQESWLNVGTCNDPQDGQHIRLPVKTSAGQTNWFQVTNLTSSNVGLYLMNPNGSTRFQTGSIWPGSVFS